MRDATVFRRGSGAVMMGSRAIGAEYLINRMR
jgi:hypothetical protein